MKHTVNRLGRIAVLLGALLAPGGMAASAELYDLQADPW